ncbi:putative bifunctional diguanylate cyclase/phosphodiesterase [Marinomonas aquiplantarum]|uniref:Diguanylate cyclase (GGDEF)-like protein n=1 Tax=Marinomonas aquiplantarum TaxID=491951 RepID=A0A366D1N6_9GAMM|nr:EAL domain-containing protein [Marinomonas aquiplantarum]RBO83835.1 diguanylate cyclase (GGDEF)-like protein [Marinomonas aquiplantarum]
MNKVVSNKSPFFVFGLVCLFGLLTSLIIYLAETRHIDQDMELLDYVLSTTAHALPLENQLAGVNWLFVITPSLIFTLLGILLGVFVHRLNRNHRQALALANKDFEIDPMTGLLSRYKVQQLLTERLVVCQQESKWLATFVLDLDHFKTINEAFGHEVGDKLLAKVAQRLTSVFPDQAVLGYFGGDAFLVVLEAQPDQPISHLESLSQEVIQQVSQTYFIDGLTLNIGCSIGVAWYPEFGTDAMTLIKNADLAVYEAKRSGRATYHFYDGEMGRRFARNVRIETRLRRAIENEQLEMHFQPKVDLVTQQCVGLEALLRWEDEELGSVSPAEFVPIAEQSGIILPLGEWVFEQTFRHILEWQKQGLKVPPIAVNCSAAQLKRADFLPNLLTLLERYQVNPKSLEIEVTESILIEDAVGCAELLRKMSQLGFSLAIDDFGTGYSSLSYLKDLPFHSIKIDQVFIRDIIEDQSHAALTNAIISLSHKLGLKVIAEGIANEDQLNLLCQFGCDVGQGYFFSKAFGASSMSSDPMILALNESNEA